eukprot:445524_1
MNRVQHLVSHLKPTETSNHTKYRYTVDGFSDKVFTKEQRDFYEENGYIIIRNLLPINDVNICNKRFDDIVKDPSQRIPEMLVMKDVSLKKTSKNRTKQKDVTKLQKFAFDPIFYKHYLSNPLLLPYIKAFCGNDLRSWHHMYINKPPDPGSLSSRHPIHQDLWYFPLSNYDRFVGCWTALQNVNRQNGGLCVIPGTHKIDKVLVHDYPKRGTWNFMYVAIPEGDYRRTARRRIHVDMKPGDVVFFHGLLFHGSSANLSTGFRRSLCCHFLNSKICSYKAFDKKRKDQTKYGQLIEIGSAMISKTKTPMKYKTFFKLKSRQIMGDAADWACDDKELDLAEKEVYKRKMNRDDFRRNPIFNQHLMH